MTADVLCLVADRNMAAAVSNLLSRPESLGIPTIEYQLETHPRRDPGCFNEAAEFLRGQQSEAEHALVILDRDGAAAPGNSGPELEALLAKASGPTIAASHPIPRQRWSGLSGRCGCRGRRPSMASWRRK